MKARAPGKLIFSGEHAVVHGRPALVMAIDRYVDVEITPIEADELRILFPGFIEAERLPTAAMPGLRKRLEANYQQFCAGQMSIRHVLSHPAELIYYAVTYLLDQSERELKGGWQLTYRSDIPVGCGLGASAAVIAATLCAGARAMQVQLEPDTLYQWTLEVERLQHGHPSGVDPFVTVHGGVIRFQHGEAEALPVPHRSFQLVDTGRPQSTTGECVAQVGAAFDAEDPIWNQFQRVTDEMETALREGDGKGTMLAIRANHRLLSRIGVVPQAVQSFIARIEQAGGAAKICGAGAIRGDHSGIVLVMGDVDLEDILRDTGYTAMTVMPVPHGVAGAIN